MPAKREPLQAKPDRARTKRQQERLSRDADDQADANGDAPIPLTAEERRHAEGREEQQRMVLYEKHFNPVARWPLWAACGLVSGWDTFHKFAMFMDRVSVGELCKVKERTGVEPLRHLFPKREGLSEYRTLLETAKKAIDAESLRAWTDDHGQIQVREADFIPWAIGNGYPVPEGSRRKCERQARERAETEDRASGAAEGDGRDDEHTDESAESTAATTGPSDTRTEHGRAYLSPSDIAHRFGVSKEALRKRLEVFRNKTFSGWVENEDRKPRESRFLYLVDAVRPIIDSMQQKRSRQNSSQPPAKKNPAS